MRVRACVCVRAHARACVRVRACACVCVRAGAVVQAESAETGSLATVQEGHEAREGGAPSAEAEA
eukprot:2047742-Pleurochrysis_carterae.AAC.1